MGRVLSTKCLSESQKNLILQSGWSLVEYNAIQTQKLVNLAYLKNTKIENAIITSQKTVSILKELQVSLRNIYCVGQKTANQLVDFKANIVVISDYGEDLGKKISTTYADLELDFFCGKSRNNDLPNHLNKNKIHFTEHHLYETKSNPKKFNRSFDAVLFYSPSGVESYYASNQFQGERLICIGKTTLAKAMDFSKHVEIASKTSIRSVIVRLVNKKI